MSLPEASDNEGRTRAALTEQNRLIDEQASRVKSLQEKAQSIQDVLAGLEDRRVALIRQQAAEQNKVYQSMLVMNGQHTEFNRLLGLGNELLQQRQGLVNVPLRLPQATLDDKQQSALTKTERELALSRLKGEEKSVSDWGMRRMTSVLWVIRIRRRDNVISVMPWKPGAITRRINPNPGVENQRRKKRKTVFPGC